MQKNNKTFWKNTQIKKTNIKSLARKIPCRLPVVAGADSCRHRYNHIYIYIYI